MTSWPGGDLQSQCAGAPTFRKARLRGPFPFKRLYRAGRRAHINGRRLESRGTWSRRPQGKSYGPGWNSTISAVQRHQTYICARLELDRKELDGTPLRDFLKILGGLSRPKIAVPMRGFRWLLQHPARHCDGPAHPQTPECRSILPTKFLRGPTAIR